MIPRKKRIVCWLVAPLLFAGCGGDEAATDTVVVGGAPSEAPPDRPAAEEGGRDVFQSDALGRPAERG